MAPIKRHKAMTPDRHSPLPEMDNYTPMKSRNNQEVSIPRKLKPCRQLFKKEETSPSTTATPSNLDQLRKIENAFNLRRRKFMEARFKERRSIREKFECSEEFEFLCKTFNMKKLIKTNDNENKNK